jgi:hypothetical protein
MLMLNNVNLFAPEFSHTYQSRNSGLAYLFKYGISSGNVPSYAF